MVHIEAIISILETIMNDIANLMVIILEMMGMFVIAATALKAFYQWLHKYPRTRLELAQGLGMALEFKLGSEILRTVVVRDFRGILQVACIFLLRAAIALLIHWEILQEEKEEQRHLEEKEEHSG